MNVRFLTLAQQEVDEAVVWFDERVEGKSIEFLDELDRVVRLVKAYPLVSVEIEPAVRKCLFARFPYALIYGIEDGHDRGHRSRSLSSLTSLLDRSFRRLIKP